MLLAAGILACTGLGDDFRPKTHLTAGGGTGFGEGKSSRQSRESIVAANRQSGVGTTARRRRLFQFHNTISLFS